jgi:quercetin dioxygenase-like cupin family protein
MCLLQKKGEPIQELQAGGTACIASGEKHWHGAGPDGPMTHLALNIDASTTWLSKVTDSEYCGSN